MLRSLRWWSEQKNKHQQPLVLILAWDYDSSYDLAFIVMVMMIMIIYTASTGCLEL